MKRTALFLLGLFLPALLQGANDATLLVLDRATQKPVEGAKIRIGTSLFKSGPDGTVYIDIPAKTVRIITPGYRDITHDFDANRTVLLEPFDIKALYLSFWGAGTKKFTDRILRLVEQTEINAVVIDVKSEYGHLLYPGVLPRARAIGAYANSRIADIDTLIARLKAKNIYLIARIVVFKDDLLATKLPELAIKNKQGAVWRNGENIAWSDPFLSEVHDYNIAIAADAARRGFDEINFDYIRFPGTRGLRYAQKNTRQNRVNAINTFLASAQQTLDRLDVIVSVDTYGYVCWNENDTGIGHQLADLGRYSDIVSPMLYPSSYHLGIPGYEESLNHIYRLIHDTLREGHRRTGIPPRRFRPWLQAFPDYAFDRRKFGAREIREQINAAEDFGSSGWMLWHPGSYFYPHGLKLPD
jgi:hypothetical protein